MALCPLAKWDGPVPNKYTHPRSDKRGLVLHISCGSASAVEGWFHNPAAQASADFLVTKSGELIQFVDTDLETAWAQSGGNDFWVSVECEGQPGDSLTAAQLETLAHLYVWGHQRYDWALQQTNDPTVPGLGWHGMGGAHWGSHFNCPGDPIKAQRQAILDRARVLLQPRPAPKPPAPAPVPLPKWFHRNLALAKPMLSGDDVRVVQRKLKVALVDGIYGPMTVAKVRGFQSLRKLSADGIVGPNTARALGN